MVPALSQEVAAEAWSRVHVSPTVQPTALVYELLLPPILRIAEPYKYTRDGSPCQASGWGLLVNVPTCWLLW